MTARVESVSNASFAMSYIRPAFSITAVFSGGSVGSGIGGVGFGRCAHAWFSDSRRSTSRTAV